MMVHDRRIRRVSMALLAGFALSACSENPAAPLSLPDARLSTEPTTSDVLLLDGFESGNLTGWYSYAGSDSKVSIRSVSPGAAGSTYAMRVDYRIKSYGGAQRAFSAPQDWSAYDAFRFHFHGKGSGNTIRVEIRDNGSSFSSAEIFEHRFVDDFSGWKSFELPWDQFVRRADWQPTGAPNDGFTRTGVWGYTFAPVKGSGNFSLDEIGLRAQPATTDAPATAEICSGSYSRLVQVSTAAELKNALTGARPGDRIALADGIYEGSFRASVSGTAEQPITLCGTGSAVLKGSSVSSGYGFYLEASHWTLQGITITNSQFGVYTVGASHNVLDNLTIEGIGQEAVRFRSFSSYNVLKNSRIRNTGLHNAEYGEGVYIGSWKGHWSTNSGGNPDASDYNRVINNVFGPDVRAEHIDAKEGTTGGEISGNTFDGRGMVASQSWIDSWVELKGNRYTVGGNTGTTAIRDGFQVAVELTGWGEHNAFGGNTADLGGASGYGFRVSTSAPGNVVRCDNVAKNAGSGLSNLTCQ